MPYRPISFLWVANWDREHSRDTIYQTEDATPLPEVKTGERNGRMWRVSAAVVRIQRRTSRHAPSPTGSTGA